MDGTLNSTNKLVINADGTAAASIVTTPADFFPGFTLPTGVINYLQTDPNGALIVSGGVTTENGSVRVNFTGASLHYSPGSATFTNGSTTVSGTDIGYSVFVLDFIKLSADTEAELTQVAEIIDANTVRLFFPYPGTSATGAYDTQQLGTVTGSGATLSVSSGQMTMSLGTNTSAETYAYIVAAAAPLIGESNFSISQRVANQDIYFGFESNVTATAIQYARFHFSGTDNTKVITETGYNPTTTPSSNESETNTITLPGSAVTSSTNTYHIEVSIDKVGFYINGTLVATHTKRLPHPSTLLINSLNGTIRGINSGSVTNTDIVVNYLYGRAFYNVDVANTISDTTSVMGKVIIDSFSGSLPAGTNVIGKVSIDQTTPGTTNLVALSAETTKVIGTVRNADGAGNLWTSNSSTYTAKYAQDANLLGTLGTAFSTAGKVDIKGADGDVFVRNATAANLLATVNNRDGAGNALTSNSTTYSAKFALDGNLLGTLGTAFSTAGKVDVKGADGDVFVRQSTATNLKAQVIAGDATGSAVPANAYYKAGLAKTSLPSAASDGNLTGAMVDKFGRQVVIPQTIRDLASDQSTTITSSTSATTIVTAVSATYLDLVSLTFTNSSATGTVVQLYNDDGTTLRWTGYAPATDMRGIVFQVPLTQSATNKAWKLITVTSVASVYITAQFIQNK